MLWSHCITLSFFHTLYIVITFGVLHMNLPWKSFTAYRRKLYALFVVRALDITLIHYSINWDWSNFYDINTYLIGRFMYRCHMCQVPELFYSYFKPICDIHHYNTRQNDCIYISPVKTNLGKMSFKYTGPYVWNMLLQLNINPDSSEASFVKSLKVCILNGSLAMCKM